MSILHHINISFNNNHHHLYQFYIHINYQLLLFIFNNHYQLSMYNCQLYNGILQSRSLHIHLYILSNIQLNKFLDHILNILFQYQVNLFFNIYNLQNKNLNNLNDPYSNQKNLHHQQVIFYHNNNVSIEIQNIKFNYILIYLYNIQQTYHLFYMLYNDLISHTYLYYFSLNKNKMLDINSNLSLLIHFNNFIIIYFGPTPF